MPRKSRKKERVWFNPERFIPVFSLGLVIITFFIGISFFYYYSTPATPFTNVTISENITENVTENITSYLRVRNFEEAKKFFIYSEKMKREWNESNCSAPLAEDSIILVMHIVKLDGNYSISCERGEAYYRFGEARPLFDECDQYVANIVDTAARQKESFDFPLEEPITPNVTNYYALYLICDWERGWAAYAIVDAETAKVYW